MAVKGRTKEDQKPLPCTVPQFPCQYRSDCNLLATPCHPSVPPQVPLGGTVGKGFFTGCLPPCRVPEVGVSGRNHVNLGIAISLFFLPLFYFLFIHHASTPGQPPPRCQSLGSLAHQTHSPKTRVPGVAWASP